MADPSSRWQAANGSESDMTLKFSATVSRTQYEGIENKMPTTVGQVLGFADSLTVASRDPPSMMVMIMEATAIAAAVFGASHVQGSRFTTSMAEQYLSDREHSTREEVII
jgi:hypothetical protein